MLRMAGLSPWWSVLLDWLPRVLAMTTAKNLEKRRSWNNSCSVWATQLTLKYVYNCIYTYRCVFIYIYICIDVYLFIYLLFIYLYIYLSLSQQASVVWSVENPKPHKGLRWEISREQTQFTGGRRVFCVFCSAFGRLRFQQGTRERPHVLGCLALAVPLNGPTWSWLMKRLIPWDFAAGCEVVWVI